MNRKEDFKASKDPMSISTQDFGPSDKAKKDKKKKLHKDKRDSKDLGNFKNSTILDTRVNMAEIEGKRRGKKDVNEVTYYICNRRGYFANKCPEPWKSKHWY